MVRRPRPPPVTGKTPRPLTPTRCTETSAKAPAPDSLKLPPPYLAKLRQLKDQTTRQRPGAANRPPAVPALPRRCHRTPGARRTWSRSAGSSLARGLRAEAARLVAPPRRWLPERPAAGLLLVATGRPPSPPAPPPPPPGWRPERRPRT